MNLIESDMLEMKLN